MHHMLVWLLADTAEWGAIVVAPDKRYRRNASCV
jgi:hypothetical protein